MIVPRTPLPADAVGLTERRDLGNGDIDIAANGVSKASALEQVRRLDARAEFPD